MGYLLRQLPSVFNPPLSLGVYVYRHRGGGPCPLCFSMGMTPAFDIMYILQYANLLKRLCFIYNVLFLVPKSMYMIGGFPPSTFFGIGHALFSTPQATLQYIPPPSYDTYCIPTLYYKVRTPILLTLGYILQYTYPIHYPIHYPLVLCRMYFSKYTLS